MALAKPCQSYVLCGDGIPNLFLSDIARNLFACHGCEVRIEDIFKYHEQTDSLALVVGGNTKSNSLAALFARSFSGYYELANGNELPKDVFVNGLEKNSVIYSFVTKTVCQHSVAQHIANNISLKLALNQDLQEKIELVLHETLANAALHGNLEIGHCAKDSLDGLEAFDTEVEKKLSNDGLAKRRIEVRIHWDDEILKLKILDQGSGFSLSKDNWDGMPWRGMNLISSQVVSVSAGENGQPLTIILKR